MDERKARARAAYIAARAAYMSSPTGVNWKAFCDAKVLCRRLGVIV